MSDYMSRVLWWMVAKSQLKTVVNIPLFLGFQPSEQDFAGPSTVAMSWNFLWPGRHPTGWQQPILANMGPQGFWYQFKLNTSANSRRWIPQIIHSWSFRINRIIRRAWRNDIHINVHKRRWEFTPTVKWSPAVGPCTTAPFISIQPSVASPCFFGERLKRGANRGESNRHVAAAPNFRVSCNLGLSQNGGFKEKHTHWLYCPQPRTDSCKLSEVKPINVFFAAVAAVVNKGGAWKSSGICRE